MRKFILCLLISPTLLLTGCLEGTCGKNGSASCDQWGDVVKCETWSSYPSGSTTRCAPEKGCLKWSCYYDKSTSPLMTGLLNMTQPLVRLDLRSLSIDRAMGMMVNGDTFTAWRLGLTNQDVETVLKGTKPTSERIQDLAEANGVDKGEMESIIEKFTQAFEEQRRRSDSVYWQTCIQSGKWSTPQNSSCEKAFWPGCSPETGADLCLTAAGLQRLGR